MVRIDIVGLTLAELALVLLFSLLAVPSPSYSRAQKQLAAVRQQLKQRLEQTEILKKQLEQMERLKRQSREPEAKFAAGRPQLRSRAIPSCSELGKGDWLFVATIRGKDSYEVDGQIMNFAELLLVNLQAIESAEKAGCRRTVKVFCGKNVQGVDYDYALRKIQEHFYPKLMGAR